MPTVVPIPIVVVVVAVVPIIIVPSTIIVWHSHIDLASVPIGVVGCSIMLTVIIPGLSRIDAGGKTDKGHSGGQSSNKFAGFH